MLALKDYQQWALDALRDYFQECCRTEEASPAFHTVTGRTLGLKSLYNEVKELPGLPYVCLRIPTGGGKTIVACHSIGIAAQELVQTEFPLVLWIVPSNAILTQTVNALRSRRHPYRQAVEAALGAVSVLEVQEALSLKRAQLDGEAAIIVATMQAFRVEDTIGRRVYRDSGDLMEHFSGLPPQVTAALERGEGGNILHSLANVLRLRRPVVIVDEAHNARTALSFDTLARFHPSCIVEFTATPARKEHPSNVLFSASAADLKAAQMIKLPIRLETRPDWHELLADAVHCRNGLEQAAQLERQQTGEYIRPVMLIQAQPQQKGRETLTVEVVKRCLLTDHRIPEEQIAIATSTAKELDGIDLARQDVPVRYVITVQALREGWDCPFAYVLCSLAESRSATAVEQILGRVMRLPGAARKTQESLNAAYAFAKSESFSEIAAALTDALVQHGFEKQEAADLIVPGRIEPQRLPFEQSFMGVTTVAMPEPLKLANLPEAVRRKVVYDAEKKRFSFTGAMSGQELEEIRAVCVTAEGRAGVDRAFRISTGKEPDRRAPAEQNIPFAVPLLSIRQGKLFEPFEESHFLDYPWKLADCDALLTEEEYSAVRLEGESGEIDITEQGRIAAKFIAGVQGRQLELFAADRRWTVAGLVDWLDRNIPHPDIDPADSGIFLTRLALALSDQRGFTLEQLLLDKYRLRNVAEKKINQHRQNARRKAYQALLFGGQADVAVSPDICFAFAADPRQYAYSKPYKGRYLFQKHYYPEIGDLEDKGEEFECAQFIDRLEEVAFWVRNPARRPGQSFWLQTATDKFYPDFVCKLKDGRTAAVEYKGGHLWNEDAKEKQALGELWAARSGGDCLFVMPKDKDYAAVRRAFAGKTC
ncbi:DEAD/DEAH box helicase family protein [Candidatus Electronema sp. JM]|uniref:DEAD/DEAH box helicase n=1 Tax=Candidatus Electronema sp. JM TaxID=3401571 RepID=UPI003AA945BB